jgi:anti-sigma factor RsiW
MSADSKDWFYVCKSHLVAGFATPIVATAEPASNKDEKAKLEAEIEKVKAEYAAKEEKRKKDEKEKGKDGSWIPSVGGLISKAASGVVQAIQPAAAPAAVSSPSVAVTASEPKEFTLNRSFYQHRVALKQQAAMEKAKEQQWKTISFPSIPPTK